MIRYLLSAASFFLISISQVLGHEDFSEGGFVYTILDDDSHSVELVDCERSSLLDSKQQLRVSAFVMHDGKRYEVKHLGEKSLADLATVESIVIDEGICSIGNYAFEHCINLKSIYIPASIEVIGQGLFGSCYSLKTIEVDSLNQNFESPQGANAIISDGEQLVACSATKIPSSVTAIMGLAFYHCNTLENLVIPEGVEVIESEAFFGCSGLKRIKLPESLRKIGPDAFCGCYSLDSIFIPKNVHEILGNVFLGCNRLSSIVVDKDNDVYDSRSNCNAVIRKADSMLIASCAATTISEDIKRLGDGCFCGVNLHTIRIPKSIKFLSGQSFSGCNEIDSLIVAPDNAFYMSPKGTNSILTKDGKTLVVGCRTTEIPDGIEAIGESAFAGRFLKLVLQLPEGLKIIGSFAFANCNSMNEAIIPSSVESVESYAFARCHNLKVLQVLSPVEAISPNAFNGCAKLNVINPPEDIRINR